MTSSETTATGTRRRTTSLERGTTATALGCALTLPFYLSGWLIWLPPHHLQSLFGMVLRFLTSMPLSLFSTHLELDFFEIPFLWT